MSAALQPRAETIIVDFDDDAPELAQERQVLTRAAEMAWQVLGDGAPATIGVSLMDDAAIGALNAEFRGKDRPTDVLSFPADDTPFPGEEDFLGDIALAMPFIRREAALENKSVVDHLSHLFVHGLLHLLGHDHEQPDAARIMEALEKDILARLGIADPYAGRELDRQEP